jgi:pimeloyl-ACP methyl ester carboxylesterase
MSASVGMGFGCDRPPYDDAEGSDLSETFVTSWKTGFGTPLTSWETAAVQLHKPDRTEILELNRTTLRLWSWGDPSAPPVLCLHGAFDHGRMWDGLAPELVDLGHHVIAPDLRGHGDSGRVSSGHVWEASALDVALLAQCLGGQVGLVGHSFGGGQALFVAAMWPELVRWVVNLDGLGPPASGFDEGADLGASSREAFTALDRLRDRPPRVYATLDDAAERRRRINVRLPEPWLEHLVRHGTRGVEGGVMWKADPMFNIGFPGDFDLETLLAQYRLVGCPVLVLTGSEPDAWSDLGEEEIATRVAALGARHHPVPAAGHYLHLERPDAVLGHIREFVEAIDR